MQKIQIDKDCKFLKDIESSSTAFMGTNRGIYIEYYRSVETLDKRNKAKQTVQAKER